MAGKKTLQEYVGMLDQWTEIVAGPNKKQSRRWEMWSLRNGWAVELVIDGKTEVLSISSKSLLDAIKDALETVKYLTK
jgi:hypothetical protein